MKIIVTGISLLLGLFCTIRIFAHENSPIDSPNLRYERAILCDTLTTQKFLELTDTLYQQIDSFKKLSDVKQNQMIKVYNSIFLLPNTLKTRNRVFDFQNRLDLIITKYLFENQNIIITKNSVIIFPNLKAALLNSAVIMTGDYECKDVYLICDHLPDKYQKL